VGYSAQEYSALEKAFLVRDRHAHAWATAWIDGRWIEVDNTPSRWADFEEKETRAWYGPALDILSWIIDAIRRNVLEEEWGFARAALVMLGLAVAVALAWWLRRRPWGGKGKAVEAHSATQEWQRVEASLSPRGFARAPNETVRDFATRLEAQGCEGLVDLARRYYVARFDPASDAAEGERLRQDVERWLARSSGGA
jgi:hypothetical protein